MKRLLFMFLVLALAMQSREYQYDKPVLSFQPDEIAYQPQDAKTIQIGTTTIIKGNNGRDYVVTMLPSRQVHEIHFTPAQSAFATADDQQQQPHLYQQSLVANYLINSADNGEFQQPFNSSQKHLNFNAAVNNAQNNYKQLALNSNHHRLQQQQWQHQQKIARPQQQPQEQNSIFSQGIQQQQQHAGYFYQNVPQQQQFGKFSQNLKQVAGILTKTTAQEQPHQQRQQQCCSHQYEHCLQQPLPKSNLPNSHNLLNDLVNNHKYVSQSEASQLDVYAYKQINGNFRPFTRTISICDILSQCKTQHANAVDCGGGDFHHQQVLKQTKALVEPHDEQFHDKINYQFTGNALTNDVAKAQRGIPIRKGTSLKDRRLFPYSEFLITQYPQS